MKGLVIYKKEDYDKNKGYVNLLKQAAAQRAIDLEVILYEGLTMGVDASGLWMAYEGEPVRGVDFVINRSRECMISRQCEAMNMLVFNNSQVTYLANHKGYTHQFVASLGIPSVETYFFNQSYMDEKAIKMPYPWVVKTPDGHGGEQVFKVEDETQFKALIEARNEQDLVVQALCSKVGEDVRVFVVGNEIIGAIKRSSTCDFRANYSLGGKIEVYTLSEEEQCLVQRICQHLKCDYVGIDFMIDAKGHFVFNEIEDVVGSRSLYNLTTLDTADLLMGHIARQLKKA